MYTIALYSLVSTALFYLGSRAEITRWLWSRYPPALARFMDCPACTGFWWGLAIAISTSRLWGYAYLGLDPISPLTWVVVGLCSIVTTPIVAGLMSFGLSHVGQAVDIPERETPKWTDIS